MAVSGLLIAALAAGVKSGANAQARSSAPVTVTECSVLQYRATHLHPFWRPFGPYPYGSVYTDGLRIVFVNHAEKTASRVAFRVNYRGDVRQVIDVGTFSPAVTIDHLFGEFTGDAWLGPKPNACGVVAVRYADGSYWHAPPERRYQMRRAGNR
jgi:hypothetical protein